MIDATRLVVLRHGETEWNVGGRIQGHLNIGLNARGRWQAQQLAAALADEDIAAIYASDLARAHDTACAIAARHGLKVVSEDGLRERSFGRFEGHNFAQIERSWPVEAQRWRVRDPGYAPEGGESLLDFRDRVTRCAAALSARHAGRQIVLVAHGGVMDVLYRAATGQELQAPRSWPLGNAAINHLLWTPQGFALVGWGDERHLASAPLDEPAS